MLSIPFKILRCMLVEKKIANVVHPIELVCYETLVEDSRLLIPITPYSRSVMNVKQSRQNNEACDINFLTSVIFITSVIDFLLRFIRIHHYKFILQHGEKTANTKHKHKD